MLSPSLIKGGGSLWALQEGGSAGIAGLFLFLRTHQFPAPTSGALAGKGLKYAAIFGQIADQIILMFRAVTADMAAGHDIAGKANDEMRKGKETWRGPFCLRRYIRQ
jgi:hypothetical protein